MVAVLLCENMLDFSGRVDEAHHQLHVALYSGREDDWLALFCEVGEEVIEIFAFVDVEEALVFLEP